MNENDNYTGLETAIIGMAGQFPGAENIEEFWDNLKNGIESISFFSDRELKEDGVEEELLSHPDYVKAMAILADIESFDADFFGYAPMEAEVLDPQVRLFHECAWRALEDAGCVPGLYHGLIGLYAGASGSFHWQALTMLTGKENNLGSFESGQLADSDFLCARAAYKLDLKGPVMFVQTACSTSLTAIHLAYQGLLSGEADIALAGGVSVSPGKSGYLYRDGMILSPDGHCRAFDGKAKGTIQGHGVGVVVLKRLEDAAADGDHIYALIKGSAINNDGTQKIGFTAPSVRMQSAVVRDALRTAQVEAESIGYIEAHGTGTILGDPVEFGALKKAYKTAKKGFCAVGSVKTNVGHLGAAAGVVGFIKTVLTLKHRFIPPALHFEIPNPKLPLIEGPFYIATGLTPWENEPGNHPLRAAVSSLGVGGTNVHVILEEGPVDDGSVRRWVGESVEQETGGREYKLVVLSAKTGTALDKMTENLVEYLKKNPGINFADAAYTLQVGRERFKHRKMLVCKTANEVAGSQRVYESVMTGDEPNVVFLFPGQDEGYVNMGQELYRTFPRFREEIDRMPPAAATALPATFVFEYALAQLLMKWGIKPYAMIGEGVGEYVAAVLAGVFSLEDALKLLAFPDPEGADAKKYLDKTPLNKPRLPFISSATGNWIAVEQAIDPLYWAEGRQLKGGRSPGYIEGIKRVSREPNPVFVTLGPPDSGKRLENPDIKPLYPVKKAGEDLSDTRCLLEIIGRLWLYGVKIDWREFASVEKRRRVSLPPYPFEGRRYHIEGDPFKIGAQMMAGKSRLAKNPDMAQWFYVPSWKRSPAVRLKTSDVRARERWLVFLDEQGIGVPLVLRLEEMNREIITVTPGSEFARSSGRAHAYTINPKQSRDYDALFDALNESGAMPVKILHLWGLHAQSPWNPNGGVSRELFDAFQYRGFYSLLFLSRAINKQTLAGEIQVLALTANAQDMSGEDPVCPAVAAIMGAVKVIPQEFPYITCRGIDIVLPRPGSDEEKQLVQRLTGECFALSTDHAAAYRGGRRLTRWVQTFEPLPLEKVTETEGIPKLREKGVYVIFGGLGKIGFEMAKYLARTVQARLILVGRSALPGKEEKGSEKNLKIKQLEEMGGEVLALRADAGNHEEMEKVVAQAEAHFGSLNGVFYAAGETRAAITCGMEHLTEQGCKKQFQARVYGLMVLEKVLGTRPLDFCLVVTSLVSVLGGLGFAAYGAAVNFMDAFVHSHNLNHPVPWVSVNTAEWLFETVRIPDASAAIGAETIELAMTPGQGVETFERILAYADENQVVISTGDLRARIDKWIKLESLHEQDTVHSGRESSFHPRPDLSSPYVPPAAPVERAMAEVWQDFFNIRPIGIDDNFFELGGDSLKVIALVSKIHREFNVGISIEDFFEKAVIRDLAGHIEKIGTKDKEQAKYISIEAVEKREYYPLSSAQKRLYLLQRAAPDITAYNMPQAHPLGKDIEIDNLEPVIKQLIARHESFRTSFEMVDEEPVQVIHEHAAFELASRSAMENFVKPFDLSRAPLLRSAIVELPGNNLVWMVDMHHIISDGTSHTILTEDFISLYGRREPAPLRLQYKDFSAWQNRLFAGGEIKEQGDYWLGLFAGAGRGEIPRLQLPTDFKRPGVFTFAGAHYDFVLEKEETAGFKALASGHRGTLHMNILAVLNTLFYKYTGQEDIIIGSGIEGRPHEDLQQIIGMFVNILPIRNYPAGEKTYEGFLKEVITCNVKALRNQDVQFEELVEHLDLDRNPSRNPLFDICVSLQNFRRVQEQGEGQPAAARPQTESAYVYRNPTSRFDMTLFIRESGGNVYINIEYYTGIFKEETIERLAVHFKNVVKTIIREPSIKLKDIEIISEEEKRQLLVEFNESAEGFPKEKTLHGLFEDQVKRRPDNIAIKGNHEGHEGHEEIVEISYNELNENSNKLARQLRERGVNTGTIAGIMVERSLEMIIGIIGILKTGGAYLPIDPASPGERIDYMLKDSKAKIWVSEVIEVGSAIFKSPLERGGPKGRGVSEPAPCVLQPAYIIYTSGSTGKPKGVPITHANVSPLLHWGYEHLNLQPADRAIQILSYYFDWSVWEIFITLTTGASLYMIGEEVLLNPGVCIDFIDKHGITVLHMTPTQYRYIAEVGRKLKTLKYLFIGAEKLTVDLVERSFKTVSKDCRVFNMYGPTEASIISAVLEIERTGRGQFKNLSSVPIGKPVGNAKLLILTGDLTLCPVNVTGELYIGGAGLSSGYLNNPELTVERFINLNKSFVGGPGGRFFKKAPLAAGGKFYKTGDLCRWLSNGAIEFSGRIDHQVKIRGYRIELEEIEQQLLKHKYVKGAVVVTTGENDKYICAYVVVQGAVNAESFREFLVQALPGYMIPSYFIEIEKIPLTANGKVDLKALPEPGTGGPGENFTAPRDEIEEKLVEIWAGTLGLDKGGIGIDDNFFDRGGHSLKAAVMLSRIHKEFRVNVPLTEIFKSPTIREFAAALLEMEATAFMDIDNIEKKDFYQLSYNQKRLWIIHQVNPADISYHLAGSILLEHAVEPGIVKETLVKISQRHESLRTGFKDAAGGPVQFIEDDVDIPLKTVDISQLALVEEKRRRLEMIFIEASRTPFDLSCPPLFRSVLVKIGGGRFHLIFTMHHIVSDGWSQEILTGDFMRIYDGLRAGAPVEPEPLVLQYRDFAAWHNRRTADPRVREKAGRFWLNKVKGGFPILQLPLDYNDNKNDTAGAGLRMVTPGDVKKGLKKLAADNNTTLFMVMFSAYNWLLSNFSEQEDIVCSVISAGRDHISTRDIVGFFINSIIVKTHIDEEEGFEDFLKRVDADVLAALQHQWYPLEPVLDEEKIPYPEVLVSFNMLTMQEDAAKVELEHTEPLHMENTHPVKFAFTLQVTEYKNGLELFINYKKALFAPATIENVLESYSELLSEIASGGSEPF